MLPIPKLMPLGTREKGEARRDLIGRPLALSPRVPRLCLSSGRVAEAEIRNAVTLRIGYRP